MSVPRLVDALLCVMIVLFPSSVLSLDRAQISDICVSAAQVAAMENDVPLDVMRAITLTETGRKIDDGFRPWPWTVNMEGAGRWFDDVSQAHAYVEKHFSRGARSFDVGCFQLNYRWHGDAFSSIEEMFDPLSNARYAASFLRDLHEELGTWSRAAGAYHSRTPKYANKYRARFDRIRANLSDLPKPPRPELVVEAASAPRTNLYPLLQQGTAFGVGSLVPMMTPSRRFIEVSRPAPVFGSR